MTQLIRVAEKDGQQFVTSLKEIYLGAGMSKPHWAKWCNNNLENNLFFKENQDYQALTQEVNGNFTKDYCCTLEMAKHLVMQMQTEKAHEYRNYLIELEKAWNSPEKIMARALKIANNQLETYKQQIEYQKPLVEFADKILGSKDSILVRVFSKLLYDEGLKIGERKLYKWLRDNKYLNSKNEPYQAYMEYFEVKESTYETIKGTKISTTTLIKPKGQLYFYNKLKKEFE